MGDHSWELDANKVRFVGGAALIAVSLLPHLRPGIFGWLNGFVPLPIFISLHLAGMRQGAIHIGLCLAIAAGLAALFGVMNPLLFSLTLVPLGFVLAAAVQRRLSPLRTGLHGALVLVGTWLLFGTVVGLAGGFNPYTSLQTNLQEGLTAAYAMYRETAGASNAELLRLQTTFVYLQELLPKILPAMLTAGVIFTVWINMTLSNWLLRRLRPTEPAWRDFSDWQLPDQLVWGFIAAAAGLLMLPGGLKIFCLNLLIVLATLFLLQGLAVLVRLLLRFRTPRALRIVIYLFLVIQAYGLILLSLLGLADIWADFRKLRQDGGQDFPPPGQQN